MGERVVIAGWGQIKQDKNAISGILQPMELMVKAAQRAMECFAKDLSLDGIMTIKMLSAYYENPPAQLAALLGQNPRLLFESAIGGNSPQELVNKAAGLISRGELNAVLIAGAETFYPRKSDDIRGSKVLFKGIKDGKLSDDMIGATPYEMRHGLTLPIQGFPLFETALWAESGLNRQDYFDKIGRRWAQFQDIALNNPYSWTSERHTVSEIITPAPENRLVAFPYTKRMTSLITVDQAAAIVIISEKFARKYLAESARRVYFYGGGFAVDRQRFLLEKETFTENAAMAAACKKALKRSHMTIAEIQVFDLYSCFPCAVSMAIKMLGIDDDRQLTVTGGLGFFGGPGNNYSLHAIASLCNLIHDGKVENGMITSLGWFMHKHAVGIYGLNPLPVHENDDREDEKAPYIGELAVPAVEHFSGQGVLETYTVLFDRDQQPHHGIFLGRTPQQKRFIAMSQDREVLTGFVDGEHAVGRTVEIVSIEPKKLNILTRLCE